MYSSEGPGPGDEPRDRKRRWVLKSERRDFFLCASGGEDPRAALCVFDSRKAAEEHLQDLSEPKMYLDTLERHGTEMPDWMSEEPLTPAPTEVSTEDLKGILAATGVEYVALAAGDEPQALEVIPAEEFLEGERQ
jgi:hypothetical protein